MTTAPRCLTNASLQDQMRILRDVPAGNADLHACVRLLKPCDASFRGIRPTGDKVRFHWFSDFPPV